MHFTVICFERKKKSRSINRFQNIVQFCYCDREKMCLWFIWLLCEYEQDLLSINWMLLSALMVSLMISYILKSCIYLTNCTLYLLFSNYCTFIVSVIMTCILMLSGEKKKKKTIVTFKFFVILIHCSFTWVLKSGALVKKLKNS